MIEAIKKNLFLTALLMAAAGVVVGENQGREASATTAPSPLEIQGFARETLPGLSTSAAYLELANHAGAGRQLVGVALVPAEDDGDGMVASLHSTEERDGISRMRPLEQLAIPAGQTVQMSPGGLHVMLEGVQLRAGEEVVLLLHFANGETREVSLPVRSLQAEKHQHHHHG